MATYDYGCGDCGTVFEKVHSMTESPEYTCPSCGSQNVSKKISAGSGIIFKGSGFYVTDYKNSTTSSSGSAEKPAEKKKEPAATGA